MPVAREVFPNRLQLCSPIIIRDTLRNDLAKLTGLVTFSKLKSYRRFLCILHGLGLYFVLATSQLLTVTVVRKIRVGKLLHPPYSFSCKYSVFSISGSYGEESCARIFERYG